MVNLSNRWGCERARGHHKRGNHEAERERERKRDATVQLFELILYAVVFKRGLFVSPGLK
jgi:hypothetical protein